MRAIYLASGYPNAPFLEATVRPLCHLAGLDVCSSWHIGARGPERLADMLLEVVRGIAAGNDLELVEADGVLVVDAGATLGGARVTWYDTDSRFTCAFVPGCETYAELRTAVAHGIPVAYAGPNPPLSAYREGVVRFTDVRDAVAWLGHNVTVRPAIDSASAVSKSMAECLRWAEALRSLSFKKRESGEGGS
jgi:hypothetical protein